MPLERHTIAAPFDIPEPDRLVTAATGQQAPIRAPGHRIDRAALAGQRLEALPRGDIPESDGGIISATGERPAIRSKDETMDASGVLPHPEQGPVLQVPQLDGPIPAPGGERLLIWTEGESLYRGGMRLPGQVQYLPAIAPHACSPAPAAHRTVAAIGARCHRPGRVKGLGKDRLLQGSPGKCRILHLDPLEIDASQ